MKNFSDENKNTTDHIAKLIGCEYERIDSGLDPEKLMELYIKALDDGRKSGYFPVIVEANDVLEESIEINHEYNGGAEKYREKLLSADIPDGRKFLNERCKEYIQGIKEYNGEDYDIYGDYDNKAADMPYFYFKNREEHILVKIPAENPWEVFAWIPFGNWNDCPDEESMMAVCKYWYDLYGAVPAFISSDVLQLYVPEPIKEKETALKLAEEQYGFCNDIVEQGTGTIKRNASELINSKVWYFWWD